MRLEKTNGKYVLHHLANKVKVRYAEIHQAYSVKMARNAPGIMTYKPFTYNFRQSDVSQCVALCSDSKLC